MDCLKMLEDQAVKSLQGFFLQRIKQVEQCKKDNHPIIKADSPPNEPEFIHHRCYCGEGDFIEITPALNETFVTNPETKDPEFRALIIDGKLEKLFGIKVVIK